MKQFLVSTGIKMGISLVVSAALKAVIEEGDSKSQLIAYAIMGIGACVAGCIVTDKIVEKLYEDDWVPCVGNRAGIWGSPTSKAKYNLRPIA